MLGLGRNVKVWGYAGPCDMRNGFDGLYNIVRNKMGCDPETGDLYLFTNRVRTRAKVLYFDRTGLCVYAKRLEKGRFAKLWEKVNGKKMSLTLNELMLFLEGSKIVGKIRISPEKYRIKSVAEEGIMC